MTKLTRRDFIGILESGKYTKITGTLYAEQAKKATDEAAKESVCAIGAILTETDNKNKQPAPGYSYLPEQLVKDLDITPALEKKIFTLNDRTGNDNWKAVIEMLRKEWNISESIEIDFYKMEQVLESYYTEYYTPLEVKEDFGYNIT